jgi:hypothetical protein
MNLQGFSYVMSNFDLPRIFIITMIIDTKYNYIFISGLKIFIFFLIVKGREG